MKLKIPNEWSPDIAVLNKAREAKIPDELYYKSLAKFRAGYYLDGESLNRKFYRYLVKEVETFRNRSLGQKNRHSRPASFNDYKSEPARQVSTRDHSKQQIESMKNLLKEVV